MSTSRILHCDGPDCERHTSPVATPPPYIPYGFIEFRTSGPNGDHVLHFCGWDCVLRHAATKEPEQVIPMGEGEGPDADSSP